MTDDAGKNKGDVRDPERQSLSQDADFKIVAEDAPVMLWLTNGDGKTVFTNSKWRKFVGAPTDEHLSGDAWIDALHPDDLQACLKKFHEAFLVHERFEMEYRLRRADGQYRHVLDTGEPYINKDGKFSGFIGSSADITERKNHENQLRRSQLELTQYNLEMKLINELNSYLQVCRTLDETYSIISYYARKIFPDCTGALYLFDDSRTLVQAVARWGNFERFSSKVISPDDCWALRQGKVHTVPNGLDDAIVCKHFPERSNHGYVCAPAIAQGEMIGFLCVMLGSRDNTNDPCLAPRSMEYHTRLVSMAADNLAMALVSLKLREALRSRSVRDPLTHLFNRGYLDETLIRELANCKRASRSLGLIMIDIDHFKSYNDTYGHDAGDYVLVKIAEIVQSKLRAGDVACRYGGEELVLIMPGASQEIVEARAEVLRDAVAKHEFVFKGKRLGSITISLGVADQSSVEAAADFLKSADTALYLAKDGGRNQVIVAGVALR